MEKRILIVDDEPELVSVLEEALMEKGYRVLKALDGLTALEMARKECPDLLILDLMLPKMDGFKVCALLKQDLRYHRIPIILFSARAQEEDVKLGEEMGANAYVSKPFDPEALFSKIHQLMKE